jgi:pimeloyl-ACP methyl ester carboxylesterase
MKVMSERIPQARYATLPDSGHVPNFERPKQFNDMLLAFFEVINL